MRIEWVHINKRSHYFVDGVKVSNDALSTIIKGVYGGEVCCSMFRDLFANGFAIVEKYVGSGNEQLIGQLERANKKIAVLEKKVTELTIKDIYSELQTA
ncbi:MAG: hypothetical protein IJG33_02760 [Selenomonadaceae bacterium]|nr:hypothetical protein [Selenomonadaceae bacterium]MBQ6006587.1 hypothetical protein [Selenomonadaceae bacterium]MBR0290090.1 hypothetical protein [Selenomonadaceae bacterium]